MFEAKIYKQNRDDYLDSLQKIKIGSNSLDELY